MVLRVLLLGGQDWVDYGTFTNAYGEGGLRTPADSAPVITEPEEHWARFSLL